MTSSVSHSVSTPFMVERSLCATAMRDLGFFKARLHFPPPSKTIHYEIGWAVVRAWNDEENAPNSGLRSQAAHANVEIIMYFVKAAVTSPR